MAEPTDGPKCRLEAVTPIRGAMGRDQGIKTLKGHYRSLAARQMLVVTENNKRPFLKTAKNEREIFFI